MRRGVVSLLVLVVAGGCAGPSGTGTPAAPSMPVISSSASAPPAAAMASSPGSAPASATSVSAPSSVDPGLLVLIPAAVADRPIVETPDAESAGASDPSVARVVARLAMGYVASASGADWAIVSVVALRPGVWSEAFFRDWRDTYDAGVCGSHGGVGGTASATISGRVVNITTCGPIHTYHVHLPGPDVVVSAAAVGDARYGELVMAGLRP